MEMLITLTKNFLALLMPGTPGSYSMPKHDKKAKYLLARIVAILVMMRMTRMMKI
jgi:hypothetical protein